MVSKKKKKKRSSPISRLIFPPISQIQTFEAGCFRMGGAIFHFSQKIGLKSTKNMRFCILHKPMGGARAPPPRPPWLRYCVPSTVQKRTAKSRVRSGNGINKTSPTESSRSQLFEAEQDWKSPGLFSAAIADLVKQFQLKRKWHRNRKLSD